MDDYLRMARKITGLARFERLSRRKLRRASLDGVYWVFAWKVPGTWEYAEHERMAALTLATAKALSEMPQVEIQELSSRRANWAALEILGRTRED